MAPYTVIALLTIANFLFFAIAFKSDNYLYHKSWKSDDYRTRNEGKNKRNYTKNKQKRLGATFLQGAIEKSTM